MAAARICGRWRWLQHRQCTAPRRAYISPRSSSFVREMGVTEGWHSYGSGEFHPVHLGDLIGSHYRILRKLGQGSYSTVWLGEDERSRRRVALKISAAWSSNESRSEIQILRKLSSVPAMSPSPVINLENSFTIVGPNGAHDVLVLPPAGRSLGDLIVNIRSDLAYGARPLTVATLRAMVRSIITAVAYIHSYGIVHRDIHPGNLLFLLDESFQKTDLGAVKQYPNHDPDRYITEMTDSQGVISRDLCYVDPCVPRYLVEPHPLEDDHKALIPERLVLSDFGSAAQFEQINDSRHGYPLDARTPEQVLGLPLNVSADIWAMGCTICSLVTLPGPFYVDSFAKSNQQDDEYIQSIIEVIGEPIPREYLERWTNSGKFVDVNGYLLPSHLDDPISDSLQEQISKNKPRDMTTSDTSMFEDLLSKIFRWNPAKRWSAKQLLTHPWLQGLPDRKLTQPYSQGPPILDLEQD